MKLDAAPLRHRDHFLVIQKNISTIAQTHLISEPL